MSRFDRGYFKLWRTLLESDIAQNPVRFSVFVHLISMANIEPTSVQGPNGQPMICPRGSLVTSLRELVSRTGARRGCVERTLIYLQKRDTIRVQSGNRGTVISIVNYNEYQNVKLKTEKQTVIGQETGRKRAGNKREHIEELRIKEEKKESTRPREPLLMPTPIDQGTAATRVVSPQGEPERKADEVTKNLDAPPNSPSLLLLPPGSELKPLEPELRGNANFEYALRSVPEGARQQWLERYEISSLRLSLINGVNHYLGKTKENSAWDVPDWGMNLINWIKIERNLKLKPQAHIAQAKEALRAFEEIEIPVLTAQDIARAEMVAGRKFGSIGKAVLAKLKADQPAEEVSQ